MSQTERVDAQYYQAVPAGSLAERVMVAARDRIYEDFLRLARPGAADRILDVGVSDVVTDAANLLERLYPHPERITALGLGQGQSFRAAFPAIAYRQIEPHAPLPFPGGAFDIACSNAVVEHLGAPERQRAFVAELARVARRAFITVPNRFFPVEHHTALPLAHWTGPTFRTACRLKGVSEWADPDNLILMSRARLAALAPPDRRARIGYTGFNLGPFSSNLYLLLTAD